MAKNPEPNPDDIPTLLPTAKPVEPDVVAKPAPPTGRKFPCPSCGAKLDFDPSIRGLSCPYCGYKQKIERDENADILERDYLEYLDKEEAKGKAIPGHSTETRCTGCGAVVLLDDKVATDKCPFCTTHLETKPSAAKGMIPPESLIPFTVDLRKARDRITTWVASLWFAPSELKKVFALGQFTGVYLPYWTYDSMTYTFYEGERGDDYNDTETYTTQGTDGREETRTRTVVRTRWSSASGEVQHFFDDVLVVGTKSMPRERILGLGEFNLAKLEPFDAAYLSGFQTERYAVNLKEGLLNAKGLMEPTIRRLIMKDIGGDHQRITDYRTRYTAMTFKHLLLPAWVAAYRYNGQVYQVTVNGQTGHVSGQRPYSVSKILGWVLVGLVLVMILILLLTRR
ncbi:MAG: hypothetical protein ACRC8S_05610 [Fimbriiglobus sp.]